MYPAPQTVGLGGNTRRLRFLIRSNPTFLKHLVLKENNDNPPLHSLPRYLLFLIYFCKLVQVEVLNVRIFIKD